jgi:Ni,Fe-hydrogenase I cytochrome b subunit
MGKQVARQRFFSGINQGMKEYFLEHHKKKKKFTNMMLCILKTYYYLIQLFDSWWGLGIFLFTTTSRTALRPTQPPIQWVPGALSLGVKQLGSEADHSPPSTAEVKE